MIEIIGAAGGTRTHTPLLIRDFKSLVSTFSPPRLCYFWYFLDFKIGRASCRESIQSNRITFKDTLNYFAILVDNKVTKWIVRLELNSAKTKNLILPNQDKIRLIDIDDIYIYKDMIIESLQKVQN